MCLLLFPRTFFGILALICCRWSAASALPLLCCCSAATLSALCMCGCTQPFDCKHQYRSHDSSCHNWLVWWYDSRFGCERSRIQIPGAALCMCRCAQPLKGQAPIPLSWFVVSQLAAWSSSMILVSGVWSGLFCLLACVLAYLFVSLSACLLLGCVWSSRWLAG